MMMGVFIGILLYGRYRCTHKSFKDPLQKHIIKSTDIDLWSISHVIFYIYIGFHYPDTFHLSMTIGALWELLEFVNGKYFIKFFKNYGNCDKKHIWWYGKYSDLIMNAAGFLIGKQLAEKFS